MPDDQSDSSNEFLNVIRQLESGGGTNFAHKTIKDGPEAGQTAIGQYGLLPNTIKEIAVRAQRDNSITPEMSATSSIPDPNQVKQTLEANPDIENQFAKQLSDRLLNKFGGDQEKAAFAWRQGHNLSPHQVEQRGYQNHPYVRKFRQLKQLLKTR